jgi:hypothetical protein
MSRTPTDWKQYMSAATYFRDSWIAFFMYVFVVSIFNCEPAPARNPALEASASAIAAAPSDVREETVAAPASAADEKPLAPLPETDVKPVESEIGPPTRGDEVKDYLWSVYQRSGTKMDSHGDFTWKDSVAASVWGLSMEDYAVGGMDPDFRELLFAAGRAMDAAGIDWSILSGFRDDFRQSLAVGLRARGGNSFHGGSVATGGYGYGCAADLASSAGLSDDKVWSWLDRHGQQFGLRRPVRGIDPAHVQPTAGWRALAVVQRNLRLGLAPEVKSTTTRLSERDAAENSPNAGLTEEQITCSHVRPGGESNHEKVVHHLHSRGSGGIAGRSGANRDSKTAGVHSRRSPADDHSARIKRPDHAARRRADATQLLALSV